MIEKCVECGCEIQEDWPVTLFEFEYLTPLGPLCEDCKDVALKAGYHFEIDTNKIKDEMALVEWGKIIFGPDGNGRKFVTDAIKAICEESNPKEIMITAGMIWAYVAACEPDEYWDKQAWLGKRKTIDKAKWELERNANKN